MGTTAKFTHGDGGAKVVHMIEAEKKEPSIDSDGDEGFEIVRQSFPQRPISWSALI